MRKPPVVLIGFALLTGSVTATSGSPRGADLDEHIRDWPHDPTVRSP